MKKYQGIIGGIIVILVLIIVWQIVKSLTSGIGFNCKQCWDHYDYLIDIGNVSAAEIQKNDVCLGSGCTLPNRYS